MNNLIGKKFGYLTVIRFNGKHARGNSWLCRCDCGKEVSLSESHLLGTKSRNPNKSCGCKQKKRNGATREYPKIYSAWYNMIKRCYNPKSDNYERYGGKGVTVCEEWRNSFEAFLKWTLEESNYAENLTLDRIDNPEPYGPDNCRWADYYIQEQNKGIRVDNSLGITGIDKRPYSYRAAIQRNGKRKYLGCFKTLEEAKQVRKEAERKYEETGCL